MNKQRGDVSESNVLVVFEEQDLEHLGLRPRQPIPPEIELENDRRGAVRQRMLVGFHPQHAITFQSMSPMTCIVNRRNAIPRTIDKTNTTIVSYHKP